jgi:hypothetical protein
VYQRLVTDVLHQVPCGTRLWCCTFIFGHVTPTCCALSSPPWHAPAQFLEGLVKSLFEILSLLMGRDRSSREIGAVHAEFRARWFSA